VSDANGDNTVDITNLLPAGETIHSWGYAWSRNGQSIFFIAHRHINEGQDQWIIYEASINGSRLIAKTVSNTPVDSWWDGTAFVRGADLSTLTWLRSDGTSSTVNPLENCQLAEGAQFGFLTGRSPTGELLISIDCPNDDLWFYWSSPNGMNARRILNAPIKAIHGGVNSIHWSPADRYVAMNVASTGITYLYVLNIDDPSMPEPIPVGGGTHNYNVSWQPMP
jgi:hypothetical protein